MARKKGIPGAAKPPKCKALAVLAGSTDGLHLLLCQCVGTVCSCFEATSPTLAETGNPVLALTTLASGAKCLPTETPSGAA